MFYIQLFVFCILTFICDAKNEFYKGQRIYKIHLQTEYQNNNIDLLKSDMVDFLKRPSLKYDVDGLALVPATHFVWFEEKLEELGLESDVHINDVYEYLALKDKTETLYQREDSTFNYRYYHRYDVILEHLRGYQEQHENSTLLNVDVLKFGETEEGRDLVYLKLTKGDEIEDKPVIVIEGGINPREWITVPAALNIVDKVLDGEEFFMDEFDWIIIPVLNPDGYEYTHSNLRFWQKTRSTNTDFGAICPGVNINRNFDINWQISDSSSSPCSHLFAGLEPGSEIETQLVLKLLEDYGDRIRMYISLQNNGGVISYPWHYEYAASGMYRQHYLLGLEMVAAIEEDYRLDASSVAIDRISGTSSDYFRQAGILYTFNIDIVDKDDSVIVPEEDIVDAIEDVWRAVAVAARGVV